MKKVSNVSNDRPRAAIGLARNLEKNLLAYIAAASAGVLSAALPAEAEVVYTPANIPMVQGYGYESPGLTPLDLNNDGKPDFSFSNYYYATHGRGAALLKLIPSQPGNEAWGIKIGGQRQVTAAALEVGVEVGPKGSFQSDPNGQYLALVGIGTSGFASGSWLNVETAYLGLKFVVNGEVHYGWARVKFPYPDGAAFLSGSIYGGNPSTVAFDAKGNLYGVTSYFGKYNAGTAFELTP